MLYDQHTWHIEVEVEDDRPKIVIYRKYEIAARKDCILCGQKFSKGDMIEVILPRELDLYFVECQDGPWGYNEHTSRWLLENSFRITELKEGKVLYKKEKS